MWTAFISTMSAAGDRPDAVFPPCTPYGVQKILEHEGIELEGKNVTVVGASNIVGKPLALRC